jgi:hypothetical protein
MGMKTPKLVKIKYEVEVAVFDQQVLLDAQDNLYTLLDEVFYNSAELVTGVQMLIGSTELKMEGQIE